MTQGTMPSYPDNLTDKEWKIIKPFLEIKSNKGGRKPKYGKRIMLDAVFYLLRTGCSWRHLPSDFPPWKSVYTQYRAWKLCNIFEKINDKLRRKIRRLNNQSPIPKTGIVDSQSVKITDRGGVHGYDGGKKINGRKRHMLVDSDGLIIKLHVTEANYGDRKGLIDILNSLSPKFKDLKKNLG